MVDETSNISHIHRSSRGSRPQGHGTDRRKRELSEEDYRTVIRRQESLGQRSDGVRAAFMRLPPTRR